eukprot:GABV01002373.1.p1 GENE.GABV01002373.1~~GABV01002373.1.p1  ORF type:complete len:146 (+),score=51.31 GABV01002373.1:188-625(+)
MTPGQAALGVVLQRLAEYSLWPRQLHAWWLDHPDATIRALDLPKWPTKLKISCHRKRHSAHGGREWTRSGWVKQARRDLVALNELVPDRDFLFGSEVTRFDVIVASVLALIVRQPIEQELKQMIYRRISWIEAFCGSICGTRLGR